MTQSNYSRLSIFTTLFSVILITGCSNYHNTTDDSKAEQESQEVLIDSAKFKRVYLALDSYMHYSFIEAIMTASANFLQVKTATEFEKSYGECERLIASINQSFEEDYDEMLYEIEDVVKLVELYRGIDSLTIPLTSSCVAECSMFDMILNRESLIKMASTTEGKADDDAMALIAMVEPFSGNVRSYGYKKWFAQTWDYGGASAIGDTSLLKAVQHIQLFKNQHTGFEETMTVIHESIMSSLTGEKKFMLTKDKVLAEYSEILKVGYFSKEDVNKITVHMQILQKGVDVYYNCQTADCDLY